VDTTGGERYTLRFRDLKTGDDFPESIPDTSYAVAWANDGQTVFELNDPRVAFWEPAKWVARLRATKTGDGVILFRTHLGAGHGGSSGRQDRRRELATELAFLVRWLGVE